MKVYIDAGHGGRDSGAVGIDGRLEKEDCQKITDIISNFLKQSDVTVIINTNPDESLTEVVKQANEENVDLFISIHRNAYYDINANGLEVWTCQNARAKTRKNAEIMYEKLCNVNSQMRQRGIKESNFFVLINTNAPAMLLELGFVTNLNDNKIFDYYINDYALAISQGICEILGITYISKTYKVVIGEYQDKNIAESIVREANLKGFLGAKII
jgi:N-acetylmuramoyl-L-alanine amidase